APRDHPSCPTRRTSDLPEPVDGFFWTMKGAAAGSGSTARVDVLLALGLRLGRPGFSVIPVGEPLHGRSLVTWASAKARPEGEDLDRKSTRLNSSHVKIS